MRILLVTAVVALGLSALCTSAAGAAGPVELTAVGRLPFPVHGYVVDLPRDIALDAANVRILENGLPVRELDVAPIAAAGIHYGEVLAVDASESMSGAPLEAAVAAARDFAARRGSAEQVGVVAFNGAIQVLQPPTSDGTLLRKTLSRPPRVAYGTRLYDALDRSLELLAAQRLSTGSVVVLSDGADLGSRADIGTVVARARARHVRIFAVGLRSGAFRSAPLRQLADATGGVYAEAASTGQLRAIYAALGRRFASEYLLRYRSDAAPGAHVLVTVAVAGLGQATAAYSAPTPAGIAPYRRSLVSRLLLSRAAPAAVSLLVAALVCLSILLFLRPRTDTLEGRIEEFVGKIGRSGRPDPSDGEGAAPVRRRAVDGRLAKLDEALRVARIDIAPSVVVLATGATTLAAVILLALVSPVFALLGLLTPLVTRALIKRKLTQVRDAFADQLPPNLQVLASALRVGHSFVGALAVVAENAREPSKGELQRVLTDEQLGVPINESLRNVAVRMASRDLEQVALLAELQRTSGGNAAEVLDTVVETLRERADLRRLVRTLTAQGRMARWILTSLPVLVGAAMWLLQRDLMRPLFESAGGQVALVLAALMVLAGSILIQRIVDVRV